MSNTSRIGALWKREDSEKAPYGGNIKLLGFEIPIVAFKRDKDSDKQPDIDIAVDKKQFVKKLLKLEGGSDGR